MTEDQAAKVLKTASGKGTGYVKTVKASKGHYDATHAATETGELACGTKPHANAPITEVSREPMAQRAAHAARNSASTKPTTPTSGSKRSSSCRSRSAYAPASCASSRGTT
jgi:hypothetical protein